MADELMLDALNPPSPSELVGDLARTGATAYAFYVLRRNASGGMMDNGSVTPEHIRAVLNTGRRVLPIVVPGSAPASSDPALAIQRATAMGVPVGPIVVDLEQFSLPPAAFVVHMIAVCASQGWKLIRYGDVSVLTSYVSAAGDWVSHGFIPVRAGAIFPMPALPKGCVADQYAVACNLGDATYDASVHDPDLLWQSVPQPHDANLLVEDDEMLMISPVDDDGNQTGPGALVSGGSAWTIPGAHNPKVDDTAALTNAGIKRVYVSQEFFNTITGATQ